MKTCKKMNFFLMLVLLFCFFLLMGDFHALAGEGKKPIQNLTITTGGVGGNWYPIGGALSEIINPKIEKYGYKSRGVPGGGVANPARVGMGEAHIGIAQSSFLVMAVKGEDVYKKPYPKLRSIAKLFQMADHFVVDEKAGVKSIRELIQKEDVKFGPGKVGTSTQWMFAKLMGEYGVPVKELEKRGWKFDYGSQRHQESQYRDKHIVGFCMHTQIPSASVMQAVMGRSSKFLSIGDDIAANMKKKWGTNRVIIPAGTYKGQDKDVETITMPTVLFSSTDVPDEVIYEIIKTMFQETEYLSGVHVDFKKFNPKMAIEGLGIELHPGAKKYYNEIGVLTK